MLLAFGQKFATIATFEQAYVKLSDNEALIFVPLPL